MRVEQYKEEGGGGVVLLTQFSFKKTMKDSSKKNYTVFALTTKKPQMI